MEKQMVQCQGDIKRLAEIIKGWEKDTTNKFSEVYDGAEKAIWELKNEFAADESVRGEAHYFLSRFSADVLKKESIFPSINEYFHTGEIYDYSQEENVEIKSIGEFLLKSKECKFSYYDDADDERLWYVTPWQADLDFELQKSLINCYQDINDAKLEEIYTKLENSETLDFSVEKINETILLYMFEARNRLQTIVEKEKQLRHFDAKKSLGEWLKSQEKEVGFSRKGLFNVNECMLSINEKIDEIKEKMLIILHDDELKLELSKMPSLNSNAVKILEDKLLDQTKKWFEFRDCVALTYVDIFSAKKGINFDAAKEIIIEFTMANKADYHYKYNAMSEVVKKINESELVKHLKIINRYFEDALDEVLLISQESNFLDDDEIFELDSELE